MEHESKPEEQYDHHAYEELLHFYRGQVKPRLWSDCFTWKSLIWSLLVATPLFLAVLASNDHSLQVYEAASLGISFASISFGACLTVAVLAIGLPGAQRVRRWANTDTAFGTSNAYTRLLFNLLWAALAQLALILVAVLNAALGGNALVSPAHLLSWHSVILFGSLLWFGYALLELIHVLLAVSQIGVVIVREERHAAGRKRP